MTEPARIVVVSGLSGAGKNSIMRSLEDIGFEAVDNAPLKLLDSLIHTDHRTAIGVDVRTRDFNAAELIETLARLRAEGVLLDLVFATAEPSVLQRRYTETRRRHPLAPHGTIAEGVETERALTMALISAANWVIDTSDLPLPKLREMIRARYSGAEDGLAVTLVSFAFPNGTPRDADLMFDARFLRNPHYIADLRALTGLDAAVRAYIDADADYAGFFRRLADLVDFLLPRFQRESKTYATIAVGCTGGRHRSVAVIEALAEHLTQQGWRIRIDHRALGQTRDAKAQKPPAPTMTAESLGPWNSISAAESPRAFGETR